ncbi:hypothetical protein OIU85_022654 [Salix viminalis]|uniref:Uncharacterized protein n=1 Tax=Salix viminalis TaxID=40686 RepID=A0A9Q0U793_SALVM|nr:hypothetical protein OIU85_022654 [Salix viminalis]
MGEAEEEGKKRRVMVESLGWLTESSILPKKHRAIEGVGASSIVQLKAQLYKSQEEAKKSKDISPSDLEYHRAKKIIPPLDTFSKKNSGVESRTSLSLKQLMMGSASYAALERKAELYEKLVRGELSDEEENEKYCVDFFKKVVEHDESVRPRGNNTSYAAAPVDDKGKVDGDSDDSVLFNAKFVAPGRTAGAVDKAQHHRLVR